MPLNTVERMDLLVRFKKLIPVQERLKELGHRLATGNGRPSDNTILNLLETSAEENRLLSEMVLELTEKGYVENKDGVGKLIIDMCCDDQSE